MKYALLTAALVLGAGSAHAQMPYQGSYPMPVPYYGSNSFTDSRPAPARDFYVPPPQVPQIQSYVPAPSWPSSTLPCTMPGCR